MPKSKNKKKSTKRHRKSEKLVPIDTSESTKKSKKKDKSKKRHNKPHSKKENKKDKKKSKRNKKVMRFRLTPFLRPYIPLNIYALGDVHKGALDAVIKSLFPPNYLKNFGDKGITTGIQDLDNLLYQRIESDYVDQSDYPPKGLKCIRYRFTGKYVDLYYKKINKEKFRKNEIEAYRELLHTGTKTISKKDIINSDDAIVFAPIKLGYVFKNIKYAKKKELMD